MLLPTMSIPVSKLRRGAHGSAVGLLLSVLGACAPSTDAVVQDALRDASTLAREGHVDKALATYDGAAKAARELRDADEARYRAAALCLRHQRQPEAESRLEALVQASPRGHRTPWAAFVLADLTFERDHALGDERTRAALERFSETAPARKWLRKHVARSAEPRAALKQLEPALRATGLWEDWLVLAGEAEEAAGFPDRAVAYYLDATEAFPYPHGHLTDDAAVRAARLQRTLERPEAALQTLQHLLDSQERSYLLGSYERPRYAEARMLMGVIARDDLHDRKRAEGFFVAVVEEHPDARLRDDALWAIVSLNLEAGNRAKACSVAERLSRDFPISRWAGCHLALCSDADRSAPSSARMDAACRPIVSTSPAQDK